MRGRYYLMISLNENVENLKDGMRISLESTSQISIKYLESIENRTLKNNNSEYIEINSKKFNTSIIRDKSSMKSQAN